MSKKNPFENLMTDPAPAAPVVVKAAPAPVATATGKRKAGRPPKTAKEVVQTTTIRLDPDDHLSVRQLALRDKMTMNELIFVALKQYCDSRGVRLTGK
jgi:hypothetical protein